MPKRTWFRLRACGGSLAFLNLEMVASVERGADDIYNVYLTAGTAPFLRITPSDAKELLDYIDQRIQIESMSWEPYQLAMVGATSND